METYRLKNIVILILILLNLFLLLLISSRQVTQLRAEQALIDQTVSLLEKNQIDISPSLLKNDESLVSCTYTRNDEAEAAFAAALVGPVRVTHDPSGANLYTGHLGSVTFRPNGFFFLTMPAPIPVTTDHEAFLRACCPSHYHENMVTHPGDTTVLTVSPRVNGLPVYGASMEFSFQKDTLTAASGFFLPSAEGASENRTVITRSAAAVLLMDHCQSEGRICSGITDITTGYLLQSTVSSPLLLTPVYRIDTNTHSYYVDAISGHVTGAKT